ncbi:hypothetical protein BH11PSE11_BH11PSE11_39430 [soil metagenome]
MLAKSKPEEQKSSGRGFVMPIRTKGFLVFAALMAYSIVIAFFVLQQKNALLQEFEQIQAALETEAVLKQADVSTFHAVMAVFASIDAPGQSGVQSLRMHQQSLLRRQSELAARLPGVSLNWNQLNLAWEAVDTDVSKTNLNRLIVELIKTKNDLSLLAEQVQESRITMARRYHAQSDSAAMTTLLLGMLGLGLLGAVISLFFQRMTMDLRSLQRRGLGIVKGYRGAPLSVTRHDEVGQLMAAVNNMAETLDLREKELMLERQKYFHQEKMAAIGSLAAGVSHEIGNPIAAIAGIAQEMMADGEANLSGFVTESGHDRRPQLILEQAQRLAAITREISEFASPRATRPEYLDLNALLRSTSSLIRFDRRLQRVTLDLDLDSQLPAIYGEANQLTQLIMNLLINAMDALKLVDDRAPRIQIATRADTARATLVIADNGCGMESDAQGRVFEAFFTTKPAGKGTGLGLSLCYSIARTHGGSIEIESTPGSGTQVKVLLPLNDTAYSEKNTQ